MTFLPGGVTAAKGFKAAGIHCGIRKNRTKKDLALIVSDTPASAVKSKPCSMIRLIFR